MAIVNSTKTNTTPKVTNQGGKDRDQNKGEAINPLALKGNESGEALTLDFSLDPNEILPPPTPGNYMLRIVAAENDPYTRHEMKDRNSGETIGIFYKFAGTVVIESPDPNINGARFDITLSTRVPQRKPNSEVTFFLSSLGFKLPNPITHDQQIKALAQFIAKNQAFHADVDWKAWAYCPDNDDVSGYWIYKKYDDFPDSETHEGKEWEGEFDHRDGNHYRWRAKPYFEIGTAKLIGGVKTVAANPAPASPAPGKPVTKVAAKPVAKATPPPPPVETESQGESESEELGETGINLDELQLDD